MPALEAGENAAVPESVGAVGEALEDARVRSLLRAHRRAFGFRLQIVVVAVDRLEVLHRRQDHIGPEAAREPDQDAGAPAGAERGRLLPLLGDFPGPEARMGLLDFREATVDIGQLGPCLDAGERAVKRGAVDLALQIAAVARQVGGFHAAFAACARTSRSKASARLTLSRFIIRSPWPA